MSTDAFAIFEAAHGGGVILDPHTRWNQLRRDCPVFVGDADPLVAEGGSSIAGDRPVYTVLGFDAVTEVLRDGTTYATSIIHDMMGPVLGNIILGMDPIAHREHRALVQELFSRRTLVDWTEKVIVPVVDDHISKFENDGRADLVSQLTFTFPVFVIAALLGLPDEDLPDFHRWAVEMICLPFDPELGIAGSARLAEYFTPLVAQRRADPRTDVISTLATAELHGARLTDQEIVDFLRFLLEAGAETTYRSSSNLLYALLTRPDVLDDVRDNRDLLPRAMEEALRWEPPLTVIFRVATVDTVLAGVPIPAGSVISINLGAANRDEKRWDNPDVFDIYRPALAHHAFGFGPHICLGMHLARAETLVMMNAVLDRLPKLRLDPTVDDIAISGGTFRAPRALPVLFG